MSLLRTIKNVIFGAGRVKRVIDMLEGDTLVVRHIFYGDSEAEARDIEQAHLAADASLRAAVEGKPYKGIDIEATRPDLDPGEMLSKQGFDPRLPTLLLVRHGDEEGGSRKLNGWNDVPLNKQGAANASRLHDREPLTLTCRSVDGGTQHAPLDTLPVSSSASEHPEAG
jgi:hypothetical protein